MYFIIDPIKKIGLERALNELEGMVVPFRFEKEGAISYKVNN